jgi:hypothetical protein
MFAFSSSFRADVAWAVDFRVADTASSFLVMREAKELGK